MEQLQTIQWFPGHMAKTKRQIEKSLPFVDAVAEIIDARIPVSSRNPDLSSIISNKPRIVLLNKCDMADPTCTKAWLARFAKEGTTALAVDCRSGNGLRDFLPAVEKMLCDVRERRIAKGMVGGTLRVMTVGIPNVGKSSFINRMAGGNKKAKVADKPGVTRGNQWFSIGKNVELLDTPGVLWPKFDDQRVGEVLAFTGAVKDEVMDLELLAMQLLGVLVLRCPALLQERYRLDEHTLLLPPYELLEQISRRRGMLLPGGVCDTQRCAAMILDEFRGAKIGRITLETVEEF